GVMWAHRNVLHQMLRYQAGIHFQPGDRVTLFASLSTAQGISTLWGALLNGATICPYAIRDRGMADLATWLSRHRVTVFISAASLFRHFTGLLRDEHRFPAVRLIRLGAERLVAQDRAAIRRHFADDCVLLHTYSSSETGNVTQRRLSQSEHLADE